MGLCTGYTFVDDGSLLKAAFPWRKSVSLSLQLATYWGNCVISYSSNDRLFIDEKQPLWYKYSRCKYNMYPVVEKAV